VTADAHVMTERELQAQVLDLARMLGYLAYHTYDSRRSVEGFPDLVLVHERSGALIFAELKSPTGRVTTAQDRWLRALALRGAAFVWRPDHLRDGTIVRALQRYARIGPPA
jgi:VRR-NUC domain